MNGAQDLGGQHGLGPVAPETGEPYFHADWEKRALGLTLSCGALGAWTIDESRHARESLPPAIYLSSSYYEIWIRALETLLTRHGFVSVAELAAGRALDAGLKPDRMSLKPDRILTSDRVVSVLATGAPCNRPVSTVAKFTAGDRVTTKNFNPQTHTRLPRYARARTGTVEAVQGAFVFPDDNAHGKGENPQWVYTVVFDATEIWGEGADPTLTVSIDAWESYLERT